MERGERIEDFTLTLTQSVRGIQSDIWTALPAIYLGPGSGKGTANAQPTVRVQVQTPQNTWGPAQNLPKCLDCPIIFPGGGGFHVTFPLAVGDEGLLVFASRCIDNWWLSGGTQAQAEPRMHDLSDGFFIPGCFSQPKAPSADWSTTTARLTTDDGTLYYEIDPETQQANIVAPGGLWVNGVMVTVP